MGLISKNKLLLILLAMFVGVTQLTANSHPNPLSIFSDRHFKRHYRPARKKTHKIIWVASKRSLASYGRMKGEYFGPVYNSPAISNELDPKCYTKHAITNKPYLEAKAIDGPLPQDYSTLFFKSKTLLPITKSKLKIVVDKSIQRIFVYKDLEQLYTFKSSTAMRGHWTKTGVFKPLSLERMHYSKKYYNSPMPWSVFFYRGFAIHGTEAISRLGHPASHGCVRTHPKSARRIYNLIKEIGKENTTIIVKD